VKSCPPSKWSTEPLQSLRQQLRHLHNSADTYLTPAITYWHSHKQNILVHETMVGPIPISIAHYSHLYLQLTSLFPLSPRPGSLHLYIPSSRRKPVPDLRLLPFLHLPNTPPHLEMPSTRSQRSGKLILDMAAGVTVTTSPCISLQFSLLFYWVYTISSVPPDPLSHCPIVSNSSFIAYNAFSSLSAP
jgi:hypothetical protein